jgi:carbonic anhydrase
LEPGDLLANAIRENVLLNMEKLLTSSPSILGDSVTSGQVKLVGGVYKLATGQVEWVS